MAEQWLSIVEYARTYNISDMTVRRRIKTGRLEAVLQDGKYFIPIKPSTLPKSAVPMTALEGNSVLETKSLIGTPGVNQNPRPSEIQVIKGHPTAPRVYPEKPLSPLTAATQRGTLSAQASFMNSVREATNSKSANWGREVNDQTAIPSSLRNSLIQYETSLIDSKALLSFCEAVLRKIQDGERKTVERFKAKLEAVEATLTARDQEIKHLRQQLEDLQLLVKILERRKSGS